MVVVGVLLPPLGQALRPFVGEAVFALLTLAFLRTNLQALRALARRPAQPIAAAAWTIVAIPLCVIALLQLLGDGLMSSDLALAIQLQVVTLPLMAAPAIAALIGLDATFTLAVLLLASLITPLSAPLLLNLGGARLDLPALDLAGLLAAMLAGSAVLGLGLRQLIGRQAIDRGAPALDGLNILALFIFIASVMGDVGPALWAHPSHVLGVTAIAAAANLILFTVAFAPFAAVAGARQGLAVGLLASQRNFGLMLAVAGDQLPPTVWLYVAVSQVPIYLAPLVFKPLTRRL